MAQSGDEPSHDLVPGKCNARKRGGGRCTQPAGWGTDHVGDGPCKLHLGATRRHSAVARRAALTRAAEQFGLPRSVDPAAAIIEALHKAAGQLDFFEAEVQALASPWVEQEGPGNTVRIEEHPAVTACRLALDRLFAFGERTVKLGLAERQVALNEMTAAVLAKVVMTVLDSADLGLSREQRELGRQLAGRQIRELAQGSAA